MNVSEKIIDKALIKTLIKKRCGNEISVALIYPNEYHLGMSNLGFQTVYGLFNRIDNVVCERAFLNNIKNTPCYTVESKKSLKSFDIIAFSISFENDYPNIYKILIESKIPPFSSKRDENYPLIIAGGAACFLNPEPFAPFMDCILIGEAEELIPQFFKYFDLYENRKENLLKLAQKIKGVYLPDFYEVIYNDDYTVKEYKKLYDVPEKIERVFPKDLSKIRTHTEILTENTTFDSTFLIEVSRGCPHGCRFCAAGYIYRPPRFRPYEMVKDDILKGAEFTDKIGLVGAAVSDFEDIDRLCKEANAENTKISCSSLRADSITSGLIEALFESGAKTIAIAPDAGSEKMRKVVNKGINEKDILSAIALTVEKGVLNLKLYFMIGLPFETFDDIDEIVLLSKKAKEVFLNASRKKGKIGNITISLNSFVPKAWTPFQWARTDSVKVLKNKIKRVKKGLKNIPNLKVNADNPKNAYIQAVFARGDRRCSELIELLYKNNGNWAKTLKETALDTDFYAVRERFCSENLPWDIIDNKIKKSFLIKEYEFAKNEKNSSPCMMENCNMCGVC
jgi:radical SAM superfamily enzyme YgiQ (UPF0313 family)